MDIRAKGTARAKACGGLPRPLSPLARGSACSSQVEELRGHGSLLPRNMTKPGSGQVAQEATP